MTIHQDNAGHMTKMAAMPMYAASETYALFILFKLRPLIDLDLFYGKVKFCNLGFYMGKCDNDRFFGNYCIL